MTMVENKPATDNQKNALRLRGLDYIELYVGNASQAAHYYRSTFGFKPVAYAGLETGRRDCISYVLEQQNIRLVLTSSLDPESPVSESVRLHGDSVQDIVFRVDNAEAAYHEALSRGATPLQEPKVLADDRTVDVKASIGGLGHTKHSFMEHRSPDKWGMAGYQVLDNSTQMSSMGLTAVDHIAVGVEPGYLDQWIDAYKTILGFHQFHHEDIATEYSAMNSKVVADETLDIKIVMMEPAQGKRRSQIQEFLNFHRGAGVQHVALHTHDIFNAVRILRGNCVEFLNVPNTYYEELEDRVGDVRDQLGVLSQLSILVDKDPSGKLMQTFTKPVQGRPTMFFEVIQRLGAVGFGSGNIKALFQAVEQEQAKRGTL